MFNYNYVGSLLARLFRENGYTLQLELHPGGHCGPLHCKYCYGLDQSLCEGMLTIKDYERLFEELTNNETFIEISGIRSDPLSYPFFLNLIRLIKNGMHTFGIHTKGYFLNNSLIKLLNSETEKNNYITISVDSANNRVYNMLHGIPVQDKRVFNVVKRNILNIYEEKLRSNSNLRINLSYLLFKNNSSKEHIEEFLSSFGDHSDIIRFSVPQVPNVGKAENFLDWNEIERTFELLKNYENPKVKVLGFIESTREKFSYCWAQRFNATIDKSGNVFPCPQVALEQYLHLIWGNIRQDSLTNIWNSEKRKKMLKMHVDEMNCRVCDRKDLCINVELNRIMDSERFLLH